MHNEFMEKWNDERALEAELLNTAYKDILPDLMKLKRYFYAESTLTEIVRPDFIHNVLFSDLGFFTKNSIDMQKKEIYRENELFVSYEFQVPFSDIRVAALGIKAKLDITYQKKQISPALGKSLRESGVNPSHLIDIEFFEYHHEDEFFEPSGLLKEVCRCLSMGGKESARYLQEHPLYREKEKIHLIFAVGTINVSPVYFPVYIGVGTNEPYGLRMKGDTGKSRFYRMDIENGFEEKGVISITPRDKKQVFDRLSNPELIFLESTIDYENAALASIFELKERNVKELNGDSRFCGFYKFKCVENEQNQLQLDPVQLVGEARTEYKKTSFDKKEKINSLIMGRWNTNDLMSLMESLLLEYTAFFDLHYAPEKIIEDMGLENMLAHLSKSTTDISRYPSRDNLSSDLYMMVRMPTRLRRAALLIGSYIATGKLEEMIRQQDVKPL